MDLTISTLALYFSGTSVFSENKARSILSLEMNFFSSSSSFVTSVKSVATAFTGCFSGWGAGADYTVLTYVTLTRVHGIVISCMCV